MDGIAGSADDPVCCRSSTGLFVFQRIVPEGENFLTRPQVDQWFVRLGCKSPIVTFGNDFRYTLSADVVRINWTLLCSRRCEQCLARRDAHTDELLVLLVEYTVICLREPIVFGVAVSSFASVSLDTQTCSLTECSLEGNWMLSCHHHRKHSW